MGNTLVVIPCSKKKFKEEIKVSYPRARDIYTGKDFVWGVRYAEIIGADFLVYDPHFGYIHPDHAIDQVEGEKKQEKLYSCKELSEQIYNLNLSGYDYIVALGPDIYHGNITDSFPGLKVCSLFAGLRAREYLHALKSTVKGEVYSFYEKKYQEVGDTPLEWDENGKLKLLWSYWKLPSKEGAFSGWLEGPPPTKDQIEWENFKIDVELEFWKDSGPKLGAWDQFHATTTFIGKKLSIQPWDSIMWLCEEEGPTPFEGYCSGLSLALNEDGFLQCYMNLKDVSCPAADYEWTPNWCMQESADGGYLLNLGKIYELSEIK